MSRKELSILAGSLIIPLALQAQAPSFTGSGRTGRDVPRRCSGTIEAIDLPCAGVLTIDRAFWRNLR